MVVDAQLLIPLLFFEVPCPFSFVVKGADLFIYILVCLFVCLHQLQGGAISRVGMVPTVLTGCRSTAHGIFQVGKDLQDHQD